MYLTDESDSNAAQHKVESLGYSLRSRIRHLDEPIVIATEVIRLKETHFNDRDVRRWR